MAEWWQSFFDADYLALWALPAERTAGEVDGLWRLLELAEGSRLLDAPCGYGRLARPLAERGALVVGVDQSAELLAAAEGARGELAPARLRYLRQDLRQPLAESGFDAALNVFSSIGYGGEDDDLAILSTLRAAVRPGGRVLVETMHRDAVVAFISRGVRPASRLPDGTLVLEEPVLDPVAGRINTAWYWAGPGGSGVKRASLRIYTITELVGLIERAGLRFRSAHKGCTPEPFVAQGADLGGRVGIVAERPT